MQHRPPTPLDFSDKEMQALQQYADLHGISTDEAATQLAQHGLNASFQRRKPTSAIVIPFKRMGK